MSYVNMIMYGAVLPSYNTDKEKEGKKDNKVINADDPQNQERVRSMLFN